MYLSLSLLIYYYGSLNHIVHLIHHAVLVGGGMYKGEEDVIIICLSSLKKLCGCYL